MVETATLGCDQICYTIQSTLCLNKENAQPFIVTASGDSSLSLRNRYPKLYFDIKPTSADATYANAAHGRCVYIGQNALQANRFWRTFSKESHKASIMHT